MTLVAVAEKPRFSSCSRISDTLSGTFSGGVGVFRLGCLVNIGTSRLVVAVLVSGLAFS